MIQLCLNKGPYRNREEIGVFPYICFVLITVFVAQKFVMDAFVKVNYTITKLYKSKVDIDKVSFKN